MKGATKNACVANFQATGGVDSLGLDLCIPPLVFTLLASEM